MSSITEREIQALGRPASESLADRLEWAGERYHDACEGLLNRAQLDYLGVYVYGWSDLCSATDKHQYLGMARQIAQFVVANFDDT